MLTEEVSAQSMTTDEGKATFHYTVCIRAQTRFGWSCGGVRSKEWMTYATAPSYLESELLHSNCFTADL